MDGMSKIIPVSHFYPLSFQQLMMSLPPVPALQILVKPFADALGLATLSLHVHEILYATIFYFAIFTVVAPIISKSIISDRYEAFDFKTSLKFRIQCVSLVQSIFISSLALWVMLNDQHWKSVSTPEGRIWDCDGLWGSVQAFATGYFVYDLLLNLRYIKLLGLAMTLHGSSCLTIYMLGFVITSRREYKQDYQLTFLLATLFQLVRLYLRTVRTVNYISQHSPVSESTWHVRLDSATPQRYHITLGFLRCQNYMGPVFFSPVVFRHILRFVTNYHRLAQAWTRR
jgi:hypothetical protein